MGEYEPFNIDAKAIRRASKGAFWFKTFTTPDGEKRWLVGCGGDDCYDGATIEEAIARLVVNLADMVHADGGWNTSHHKTPDI